MRCKKCGKKIKKEERFCNYCGYYNGEVDNNDWELEFDDKSLIEEKEIPEEDEVEEEKEDFKIKANASGTKDSEFYYENEDLLEAYIGEDYKLIKKIPFNIYAFLLNWCYFLYRKMYITGIVGLLITAIIIIFFNNILIPYWIIMMIILGVGFNFYYVFVSKRKIEYYMKKYDGSDKFGLLTICEEKGGVNIVFALIIYFIFLLIIFFNFVSVSYNKDHNKKFWQENSENLATCTSLAKISYGELETYKIPGKIEEAVCKISKTNFTEYSIYLKTKDKSKEYYAYFQTEDGGILYKHNTSKIKELELKQANDTITPEEQGELNSLKQIAENYEDISKKAKSEDLLIKQKKNTKEKLNYIISKEEIIR